MTADVADFGQYVAAHDIPPLDWTRDLSATLFRNWDDRAWFFKGNQCVCVKMGSDEVVTGPGYIEDLWTSLAQTIYADGFDAALSRMEEDAAFFFKGSRTARIFMGADKIDYKGSVGAIWPALAGTSMENGVDAAFARDYNDLAWFFKDDKCLCTYMGSGKVAHPIDTITQYWPHLEGTRFAQKIDAALLRGTGDAVWLFTGDLCVKLKMGSGEIMQGPSRIADEWASLARLSRLR